MPEPDPVDVMLARTIPPEADRLVADREGSCVGDVAVSKVMFAERGVPQDDRLLGPGDVRRRTITFQAFRLALSEW